MIDLSLGPLHDDVQARHRQVQDERILERILDRDPTVWVDDPGTPEIRDRLGWLELPEIMGAELDRLADFTAAARRDFRRVVLCGMGGSSLAPEVMWRVFGEREGYPTLHLLDSTHPDAVRRAGADWEHSLFLIASKSGTTIETTSFERYFWELTGGAGVRFVAITDPDTPLAERGRARGYREVFCNPPDIGGRYSALSLFGLVPGSLVGVDLRPALAAAASTDREDWVMVGVALGLAARQGRDKLIVHTSRTLGVFGLWLEQLLAESTGKDGTGVLPVPESPHAAWPEARGDRIAVRIVLDGDRMPATSVPDDVPRIEIRVRERTELGALFLGWELATAVAAHVLGVHPFDQPNVAESKAITARVLAEGAPHVRFRATEALRAWLGDVPPGHYVAVLAYVPPDDETDACLARLQDTVRGATGATVTVGYGPRYLHSTGQFHKGGPATGHYVVALDDPRDDVPIPGEPYGFADLLRAQAAGDREALMSRGRPLICVGWAQLRQEFDA